MLKSYIVVITMLTPVPDFDPVGTPYILTLEISLRNAHAATMHISPYFQMHLLSSTVYTGIEHMKDKLLLKLKYENKP